MRSLSNRISKFYNRAHHESKLQNRLPSKHIIVSTIFYTLVHENNNHSHSNSYLHFNIVIFHEEITLNRIFMSQ